MAGHFLRAQKISANICLLISSNTSDNFLAIGVLVAPAEKYLHFLQFRAKLHTCSYKVLARLVLVAKTEANYRSHLIGESNWILERTDHQVVTMLGKTKRTV